MKWMASTIRPKEMQFIIEEHLLKSLLNDVPDQMGYYLYVYENGKCTYDYLQDTLEIAIQQAFEDFDVPKDAWQLVEK